MPNYMNGSLFLIQIEVTATPGTYQTVAGLRSTSMTINNEMIDVTNKTNMPWRELIEGGVRTFSISGSGVFNDDQSMLDLIPHFMNGTIFPGKIISEEGDEFACDLYPSSFERSGEHTDAEQFSITLESSGTVTYTAA